MWPEVWNQYDQVYALYKEKSDLNPMNFKNDTQNIVKILIVIVLPLNTFGKKMTFIR